LVLYYLKNKLIILKRNWEKLDLNREWIKELIENIVSDRDELNARLSKIENLYCSFQKKLGRRFLTYLFGLGWKIPKFPPSIYWI